jgi:hypothetical protein
VTEPLRLWGPLLLALVASVAVEQLTRARGLDPPAFQDPWRRAMGMAVVAGSLWLAVFFALGQVGLPAAPPREIAVPELFSVHLILLAALFVWLLTGYAGMVPEGASLGRVLGQQLGLAAARPWHEMALGVGLGLIAWPLLIGALLVTVLLMVAFGGEQLVPQEPPDLIVWLAGLPVVVKLGIALSAGVVEEIFFRGFLQPRVGIALSTLLFVLAHLSYDQPFMLIGVTLLSLFFAGLVAWRQNLWAAIAAHTLFDAVQLLFLIPWVLREWSASAAAVALAPG